MQEEVRRTRRQPRSGDGFTLIEMLIVIIVLGILAMIIIPQVSVSTEDAKVRALQTNLGTVRSAVETYYAQHNAVYPGTNLGGAADAATAFVQQLTRYTTISGTISNSKNTTARYGPYLKSATLPQNPFTESSTVNVNTAQTDITVRTAVPGDGTAWKFYSRTGVFVANDTTGHDDY